MALEIVGLNKTFMVTGGLFFSKRGEVKALDNVSLAVANGESLGVVGESGSGKTTLAKVLAGFVEPDSGEAKFQSHDLLELDHKARAKVVQMVFQDPYASLNPKLLLGTQLLEALDLPSEQRHERAVALLEDVGLQGDALTRYPHQLSGGQRQRFAIARALAKKPELLIADEPVSALDLSVQAQIINLLNELRREKKFTLLVISHDLAVVAHLCDQLAVMRNGAVVEKGPAEAVLGNPQAEYTQRLLAAVPTI